MTSSYSDRDTHSPKWRFPHTTEFAYHTSNIARYYILPGDLHEWVLMNSFEIGKDFMKVYVCTAYITLRPRQNGRHFPDDIFKCIFLNEKAWIPIKIPLKFVPKVPIDDKPVLVQKMAWHRLGAKPLFEPMLPYFIDAYMAHSASMSHIQSL